MKTRIVLADDHQILREGLKVLLQRDPNIEVIADASDGEEAIRFAKKYLPEIVIMDVTMPNLNGIEATGRIKIEVPEVRVIALSMYFDKHFVAKMLRAGARAYLRKDCDGEELLHAISIVAKGKYYISPNLGIDSPKEVMNGAEIPDFIAHSLLTSKEREVLQLVAEGKSTKVIAQQLHVSIKTIDHHRQRIMEKLDLHSVAELTKFAVREGLTSLE
jgi:DNA-binding NarL/FixJ family response regulator